MLRAALVLAVSAWLSVAASSAPAAFPGHNGALLISASVESPQPCEPIGPPQVVARVADDPDCGWGTPYAFYLAGPGRELLRWRLADVGVASTFTASGRSVMLSKGPPDHARLYLVAAVAGARASSLHRRGWSPASSPDGRWLAYVRTDLDGPDTIWVASTRGGPARFVGQGDNPRWSSQGRLAFAGRWSVVATARGGRHPRRVTRGVFQDWSPSGRQLLLSRTFDKLKDAQRSALYAVRPDGRRLRRMTSFIPYVDLTQPYGVEGTVSSAVWSPDGHEIAMLVHSAYRHDVYLGSARSRSPQGPHAWRRVLTGTDALHDWQPLR